MRRYGRSPPWKPQCAPSARGAAPCRDRHLDRQPHASQPARRSSPSPATRMTAMISSPPRSRPAPRSRSWRRHRARRLTAAMRRCSSSMTCSAALRDLARAARAPIGGKDRRGDRIGRQDLDQGGAGARARRQRRDPRLAGVVQQSLGRAAVARALAAERALRRVRDRHEPCRRDRAAGAAWCGRMSPSSPRSSRCIWNSSPRSPPSPTPRRKSLSASCPAARRSSTATTRITRGCAAAPARPGSTHRVRSAPPAAPTPASSTCALQPECSAVEARISRTCRSPTRSERRGGIW